MAEGVPIESGPGSIAHGQATVTTLVVLRAADPKRRCIIVQNKGTGTLYLGASGVGTADGIEVGSGGNVTINAARAALYAIASGSCDVRFLEELAD